MPSFSTARPSSRFSRFRERAVPDALPPSVEPLAELPLPRHLLVSLAGIAADVSSLQQRWTDTPDLHTSLETIQGRIDLLVDLIYDRAATPGAPRDEPRSSNAVNERGRRQT
ncbi:MAG: hypothetical protein JJT89_14765 [Nitriliruptoraceae bacterium]|nr:hypothetical protein [Nitriliruptoraceae bacterium]